MSRGGSSITFQIVQKILLSLGYKHYDPEGDAYRNGGKSLAECPELLSPIFTDINKRDVLVGPFRNNTEERVAYMLNELISKCDDPRIVIITRDPVDCLYSWYYARRLHPGWSNKNVVGDPSPSEFAVQLSPTYHHEVTGLIDLGRHPAASHYAYQDIVFAPTTWLRSIIETLGVIPDNNMLAQVSSRMAFINPFENKLSHRRSGVPGATRSLLDPDSLASIDATFSAFNSYYSYPRQPVSDQEMSMAMELSSLRDSISLLMTHNAELRKALKDLRK
jgi:hypothetical protein